MKKQIIIAARYHVIRKIGEGGMAKVYLAYDNIQEINVALKVLRKENIQENKIKHFKREANALSMMDNINIVKIFDVGEEGDIHYIVNEYVQGMTLKEYISTCSPLPIEEVIEISRQIIEGLDHAHTRGVVHKDIKSQNILLDENKNVKITDFGIADIMDDDMTKTQSVMGTPQYVAPEILNREELTAQSDIYSVGILMYEMLVGQAPFTGEKPAVIMIKQMNHPLPSIREQRADVVQSLENIVIKAAAKTLENRYKNAKDLLFDLSSVLEEERVNEKKLILLNDVINEEILESQVLIEGGIDYNNMNNSNGEDKKRQTAKKTFIYVLIPTVIILFSIVLSLMTQDVIMPNLELKSLVDAQAEIELLKVDPSNIKITYQESEEVEKDLVISTVPTTGEIIEKDVPVELIVSSGEKIILMPDYDSKLYENAKKELEILNNKYIIEINEVEDPSSVGTILSQSPAPNTPLEDGQSISFEVSTGITTISVPNFYNLSEDDLDEFASQNGLLTSKTFECNDVITDKSLIFSQNPKYGTIIVKGDTITVKLSNGEKCSVEEEKKQPVKAEEIKPEANKPKEPVKAE